MIKLLLLMIVLAAIAVVIVTVGLIAVGARDRRKRLDTKPDHKEIINSEDAAWLYANGASLTDIKLAEAQRRMLK